MSKTHALEKRSCPIMSCLIKLYEEITFRSNTWLIIHVPCGVFIKPNQFNTFCVIFICFAGFLT